MRSDGWWGGQRAPDPCSFLSLSKSRFKRGGGGV